MGELNKNILFDLLISNVETAGFNRVLFFFCNRCTFAQ